MGDALIFGMYTMHGSLSNTTGRFRLSCDTRYQRADEPVDERWIGENPDRTLRLDERRDRPHGRGAPALGRLIKKGWLPRPPASQP